MVALLVFVALVAAGGVVAAQFEPGAWYAELAKPAWTPPNWLFAPVWTLLYAAIAVAGWLTWRRDRRISVPVALWGVQLALNVAWSWLFFGLHRPGIALVDILLLLVTIAAFAVAAWPVSRTASALFIPYWLWVAFATALNAWIWRANPAAG